MQGGVRFTENGGLSSRDKVFINRCQSTKAANFQIMLKFTVETSNRPAVLYTFAFLSL